MLIDWFTVVAQIINFLILLFLLHRFLYKPILKTIDKRQDQMEARWQSAQAEKEKAEAEAKAHRQAQRELDDQRDHLLAEAQAGAEAARRNQIQQVRSQIEQKRQEWQRSLAEEQRSTAAELQQQFGQQVITVVRHILSDLASAELEQQVIRTFQQRLHALDAETRQTLAEAFANRSQAVTVQTSLELPQSAQEAISQTLRETNILNGQTIQFDQSSDLIFGIRLQNEAYDLSWNADDYLRDLEKVVNQALPTAIASQSPKNQATP